VFGDAGRRGVISACPASVAGRGVGAGPFGGGVRLRRGGPVVRGGRADMSSELPNATAVVEVGGSLFDVPDLGRRLDRFLNELNEPRVLLVPGGGPAADVVRTLDRAQNLGEEASHWLALRAMTMSAHVLAALVPKTKVIEGLA